MEKQKQHNFNLYLCTQQKHLISVIIFFVLLPSLLALMDFHAKSSDKLLVLMPPCLFLSVVDSGCLIKSESWQKHQRPKSTERMNNFRQCPHEHQFDQWDRGTFSDCTFVDLLIAKDNGGVGNHLRNPHGFTQRLYDEGTYENIKPHNLRKEIAYSMLG